MKTLNRVTKCSWLQVAALLAATALVLAPTSGLARTAVYTSSATPTPKDFTTLSTAGDKAGPLLPLNQWIGLKFSQPFGTSKTDSVSIFTLAPTVGDAQFTISFGVWNSGSPIFVVARTVNAGNTLSIGNLFQQGCSALGGCDFIQITTTRQRKGAPGGYVDYVDVNGEVTTVTAPAPEPSIWILMIVGFGAIAMRLKMLRAARPPASLPAPA